MQPVPCQNTSLKNEKMTELIRKFASIREHEHKHDYASMEEMCIDANRELDLLKLKRRKAREEFRQSFDKGTSIKNLCLLNMF